MYRKRYRLITYRSRNEQVNFRSDWPVASCARLCACACECLHECNWLSVILPGSASYHTVVASPFVLILTSQVNTGMYTSVTVELKKIYLSLYLSPYVCIRIHNDNIHTSVSYTHLDVYKRQVSFIFLLMLLSRQSRIFCFLKKTKNWVVKVLVFLSQPFLSTY